MDDSTGLDPQYEIACEGLTCRWTDSQIAEALSAKGGSVVCGRQESHPTLFVCPVDGVTVSLIEVEKLLPNELGFEQLCAQ